MAGQVPLAGWGLAWRFQVYDPRVQVFWHPVTLDESDNAHCQLLLLVHEARFFRAMSGSEHAMLLYITDMRWNTTAGWLLFSKPVDNYAFQAQI